MYLFDVIHTDELGVREKYTQANPTRMDDIG
jgi:hypothetical protein